MMIYYLIMELYYYYFVGISYERFGYTIDVNSAKYIETKIIFILLLIFSVYISRISEFIYSIFIFFFVLFTLPAMVTYSLSDQISAPLYFHVALLFALGTISVHRFHIPAIRTIKFSYSLVIFFLLIAVSPILFTYGIYFDTSNLLFQNVYDTRDIFYENSSTLINYFYNWLIKAIVPVSLVFFLIHKRKMYSLIPLFILFYLYIISGNKIVFVTLFVVLFFFIAGNDHVEKTRYFMIALIIGLMVIPLVDNYMGNHSFKGLFVMRMLFLPSQLDYCYFDFFAGKPLYFAESNFFKMFVSYPFNKPVGYVIAETYFNAPDMNGNNGIISDGYMNLGYAGVVLNIIIVSVIFLFFNSADVDPGYLGIFLVIVFLFLSAPMLSMFITSGLWILFLMALTFMRRERTAIKS